MIKWVILVVLCSILGATAQILFKVSINPFEIFKLSVGFMLYGIAFLLYLVALRHLPLTVAYPLIALSYIFTAIGGSMWLGEPWSAWKTTGTIGLIISVGMIAR